MKESKFNARTLWAVLAFFCVLYVFYAWRQNSDVFFESQFLHIPFLRDLISSRFTLEGFFTVFGEHLFPGYNVFLALNYALFRLWGGFDTWIFAAAVITAALIIVSTVLASRNLLKSRWICAFATGIAMLSVTNNPQWGMALSAAVGVTLFVGGAACLSKIVGREPDPRDTWIASLCFASAILLFSGGYAIGIVASIGALILCATLVRRRFGRSEIIVGLVMVASLVAYAAIVAHYGSLLENRPTANTFSLLSTIKFALVMSGASVLGKAFFEHSGAWTPYYLVGAILLASCFAFWNYALRKLDRLGAFFFLLSFYSFCNVLIVSLFRYRNGLEGAMGQWYNIHTHFLILGPVYCFIFLGREKMLAAAVKSVLTVILLFGFGAGYLADWKKAPYVANYKNTFADQAPLLLASPRSVDVKNEFSTMLWNYPAVKEGLDLLYQNRLWRFKNNVPLVSGVDSDGWVQSGSLVTVLCPAGSVQVSLSISRDAGWPASSPLLSVDGSDLAIFSRIQNIATSGSVSAIVLRPTSSASVPGLRVPPDSRVLAAKINGLSCLSARKN